MTEDTRREMEQSMPARVFVLRLVVLRGPLRLIDIVAELDMNLSTVTRHVHELEEEGQVVLAVDPGDPRAGLVQPTPAGREEIRQVDEIGEEMAAAVLAGWTAADVRALAGSLNRLADDWAGFRQASARRVRRR